jgi:hypothetical protein
VREVVEKSEHDQRALIVGQFSQGGSHAFTVDEREDVFVGCRTARERLG